MLILGLQVLVSALCVVLAAYFAATANEHAKETARITRQLRQKVEDLDLDSIRNGAAIKKLITQFGGLSRGNRKAPQVGDDGLPDPAQNPEEWRAAVRRMALHQQSKPPKVIQ